MTRKFTNGETAVIILFTSIPFLLHLIVNIGGAYGFFRDELYYIACSEHLDWGYVDQPPLSLFLLKLVRLIFGDSLVAIRILPALAISATIFIASHIVKKIGGNLLAITLAATAITLSPIHLAMASYYSMNSLDILIWSIVVWLMLEINETPTPRLWIILGFTLGLGVLNKISVLFLGAGVLVSIVMTNVKLLKTLWPYVCALIALVIFFPYVIWNMQHDYAHLEFIRNASGTKYGERSAVDFIKDIIFNHNPLTFPLWMTGLIALWFYRPLRAHSIILWLFVVPFVILLVNRTSKGEYLTPAFVIVLAAGAVFIEQQLKPWITSTYLSLLLITGLMLLPFTTPILPVEKYIAYADYFHMKPQSNENKALADLPQFYADMFGWKEKARDVARVYQTLSDENKSHCAIFSSNYGRCGAIDFFGTQYGLPKSIGNHNNYWIWGPRNYKGDLVIILGGSLEDHQSDFESCTLAGVSRCEHCMPYENNVNIFLCRGLKKNLQEIWKDEKHYD